MHKINTKKLRFVLIKDALSLGDYYEIKAKRISSGKYETIGSCHLQSKQEILNGRTDLIKFNFQLQTI